MSSHLRKAAVLLPVVGVIVALSTLSFAQKTGLPKYDMKAETHYAKANVQDVKDITLPNGQQRQVLTVKAGDETFDVYLCPKAFLSMMDTTFAKGDVVDITASKVSDSQGNSYVLAREVIKDNNTIVLRDKTGEPAWTWMEKEKKSGEGK